MAEFSINRCLRLIRMHTMENWKVYLISLGLVALINLCFAVVSEDGSLFSRFYPLTMCLSGCLMASSVYRGWARFGRSALYLLLPASSLEKFIAILGYCTLIFIPVFTTIYFLTGYVFLSMYHPVSFFEMFSGGKNSVLNYQVFYSDSLLVYFLLLPLFLMSAARFRKYPFPATLLILLLLFITYNYCQLFLLTNFSGGLAFGHTFFIKYGDFDYYQFAGQKHFTRSIDLVFSLRIFNILAWTVIGLGLYLASFHSLKEREL